MSESAVPTLQIETKQMTSFSKKSLQAPMPVEFSGQNASAVEI
jgi:hypothetical protein